MLLFSVCVAFEKCLYLLCVTTLSTRQEVQNSAKTWHGVLKCVTKVRNRMLVSFFTFRQTYFMCQLLELLTAWRPPKKKKKEKAVILASGSFRPPPWSLPWSQRVDFVRAWSWCCIVAFIITNWLPGQNLHWTNFWNFPWGRTFFVNCGNSLGFFICIFLVAYCFSFWFACFLGMSDCLGFSTGRKKKSAMSLQSSTFYRAMLLS